MQGIRDRGWAVCCGQEVDSGDAWVESRRKRTSAKQPEEIIRKDKRKKTADATEIPDGRGGHGHAYRENGAARRGFGSCMTGIRKQIRENHLSGEAPV